MGVEDVGTSNVMWPEMGTDGVIEWNCFGEMLAGGKPVDVN